MKKLSHLLASLLAASALFGSSAFAETPPEKAPVSNMAPAEKSPAMADKLNINSATAAEIQQAMVGIGAKKAEAIVQYREKHGNFTALEQLLEVKGIGKATLEKNRDRLSL